MEKRTLLKTTSPPVPPSAPSGLETQGEKPPFMKSILRDILQTILLALLIFVIVQSTLHSFRVEGGSMVPNLDDGERLLVNKAIYFHLTPGEGVAKILPFLKSENGVVYLFHRPQIGDVVVLRPPTDPGRRYIKRVVATPGQTVEIITGKVYVNGAPLDEPYLSQSSLSQASVNSRPLLVVPPESYYVLGDNRSNSSDSRSFGTVSYESIVGKAWLSYWPPSKLGLAPNYSSQNSGK